jgi:L-fuculose-phosphate aldolase
MSSVLLYKKGDVLIFSEKQRVLIDELIQVGADIVARKMTKASAGNLSFRDPEDSSMLFITASGSWLDDLDQSSFTKITLDGLIIAGTSKPSTEWRMHAESYQARVDAQVLIHAHPKNSVLLDALSKPIRFFTLDHISYARSYGSAVFEPNGSSELAKAVAKEFESHDLVIMSFHGLAAVGETVTSTYRKMLNMEDAAEMTYRALLLGDETSAFPQNQTLSVHN